MPADGLGYGLLRYLNPDTGPELAGLSGPQIAFNYLGRFATTGDHQPWEPIATAVADLAGGDTTGGDAAGGEAGVGALLAHPLEVNALAYDDGFGPSLVANWTWADALLDEQEVRALADGWFAALRAITTWVVTSSVDTDRSEGRSLTFAHWRTCINQSALAAPTTTSSRPRCCAANSTRRRCGAV